VKHTYLALIIATGCHYGAEARTTHAPTLARIAVDRPPQTTRASQGPALRAILVPVSVPARELPSFELVKTLGSVIDARCNGIVSAPSEQTIMVEGQAIQQRCGLVSEQFRQSDYEHHVSNVCNETLETVSPQCMETWYGRFISSVMTRYSAADWRTFPAWCESHPSDCDDLPKTEIWFLRSHSAQLYAAYNDSLAANSITN
jgi:hypothetical protein